ncbi:carboxymuconolactone decarboxylase family protein [Patulibacter medicamentivorans]|uniref:carboxymuconolactone decarboxylase family protein n=1 Tax=Patulibacter medicamentivorans TaxID=1097667 RepID=UPI00058D8E5A|nr:carboxymuconolactone decarboxylase family protein [Patulibacter medicamentivorans]
MGRISEVQDGEGGLLGRFAFRASRKATGKVMGSVRVMLRHPRTAVGVGAMEHQLERSRDVEPRLVELAVLKAATVVGCEYCMDIGSFLARTHHGVPEEQIRDLVRHRESPAFDERERLVLDYAAAMSRTPAVVDDELFAALRERFDERQVVHLTSAIAWEQYRARFNAALEIPPDGFSTGTVCAIPVPAGPPLTAGAPPA